MSWTADGSEFRVPVKAKFFSTSTSSRPILGPIQTHIQWVQEALSPEIKLLEREADHSLSTTAEVKNTWIYISTPQ
jgi:hypothetical protein